MVAVGGAVLQYHDWEAAVAINDNDNEKILKAMPKETPTWEELKAGYTLRPSEEYLKQFEFEEAEVIETKLNDNGN